MNYLVVFQEVARTRIFDIDAGYSALADAILACHGQFAGLGDCEPEIAETIAKIPDLGEKIYDSEGEPSGVPFRSGGYYIVHTGVIE